MEHCSLVRDICERKMSFFAGKGITSIPVIEDRLFWDSLDMELASRLIADGEEELNRPWNQLLFSDYYRFSKDGNREIFEGKYFERRKKLSKLLIAECVENNGRFLESILDGIYLILQETTWCVPAHNSYIRDQVQLPVPDANRPIIDLFAGESAALVGLCEYILRKKFQEISPFISDNVNSEIRKRILIPYLNYHFWWMGNGLESVCNWTPWITQNVLLAVMTRRDDVINFDEKAAVLRQAVVSIDYFLDEYGEDGCCNEGAQYYSHAGLCLYGCLELLDQLFAGEIGELFENEKIKNIADYILKVYVGNQYYINFADCSPLAGRRTAREYLFGKRTGNTALALFAAKDYAASDWDDRLLDDEQNLYYHILQVRSHAEMMELSESGASEQKKEMTQETIPDVWYPSVGLMIARDSTYLLAAKAGNNADSHNHNDVGSVIVYKNARPVLIDLGVETYTKKTFSAERYEIWTMQSAYHNLPVFDNVMQKEGSDYAAAQVKCQMDVNRCNLSMEISKAYPTDLIQSYYREASLIKGEGVRIHDIYSGQLPCMVSFITYEEPVFDDEKAIVFIGQTAKLMLTKPGSPRIRIEELPITDARLGIAWHHSCYRILVEMEDEMDAVII